MNIVFFPDLYEDELIYSVLARYHAHSGYIYFKSAVNELFVNPKIRPDKEFIKNLRPEVVKMLTNDISFAELLEKHTMAAYYGRFLNKPERERAFKALVEMRGDFSKLFRRPKKGEQRFFRYCPLCVKEDRKIFGETYWHRLPQVRGISVCPVHKCYLMNSSIPMDSTVAFSLVAAEQSICADINILEEQTKFCENQLEIKLAEYMKDVFNSPIRLENEVPLERFFHARLSGTAYLSKRGEHRYYNKLWMDMQRFYADIPMIEDMKEGHLQRLLYGDRVDFDEVCLLAMFLNIPVWDLINMEMPKMSPEQQFDDKVKRFLDTGMSIKEAARRLGVSSSTVRLTLEISNRAVKNRKRNIIIRKECQDWDKLDQEKLPVIKKLFEDIGKNFMERPYKISYYAICKRADIPCHKLQWMKMCKNEIASHFESREQYLARKIKWAVTVLEKEGKPIKCWRICNLVKAEVEDIRASISELAILDSEIAEMVTSII